MLNVLTYPEFRRQGIATQVINHIIAEAKLCGVSSIDLMAMDAGKPLYQKLGFCEANYTPMRRGI